MRKKIPVFIIILIVIAAITNGCYYDNEETLYPSQGCDTAVVKYSQQVTGILTNRCYECHNNANAPIAGGGVSWEGYANLSGYLNTGASYFMQCLKHSVGANPMPKDRPKLSECEIRTIEIWIENGFPNN